MTTAAISAARNTYGSPGQQSIVFDKYGADGADNNLIFTCVRGRQWPGRAPSAPLFRVQNEQEPS